MNQPPVQPGEVQPGDLLVDPHGRRLHYLRLSVTDRCNLRCIYCVPAGGVAKLRHSEILSLEELAKVAGAAVSMGVDKIRLTGGEPLVRRDLGVLLDYLHHMRPRPDLRITTNGYFLAANLPMLLKNGVSTVNVSLDTLDPVEYGEISGMGSKIGPVAYERVWKGIHAALNTGVLGVKINVVLLAGINDHQAPAFARLTQELPLAVRFIEYMPVGRHTEFDQSRFVSSEDILESLRELGDLEPIESEPGDGPARRFRLAGAPGELGVISAVSSHFCETCNRLRVSADGRLVPCLLSNAYIDLKPMLRAGCSQAELIQALGRAAAEKPMRHDQSLGNLHSAGCSMSRLGG